MPYQIEFGGGDEWALLEPTSTVHKDTNGIVSVWVQETKKPVSMCLPGAKRWTVSGSGTVESRDDNLKLIYQSKYNLLLHSKKRCRIGL